MSIGPTAPRSTPRFLSGCLRVGVLAAFVCAATSTIGIVPAGATRRSNLSIAQVERAVVDVNTVLANDNGTAAGTGMMLSSTGEVLTNNHVIRGAASISVTDLGNGKTYIASVVGYDVSSDVAVLQLENASDLPTITVGASSGVTVGTRVRAIGNAGGTGGVPHVTSGTITALDESITASDEEGGSEQLNGLFATNASLQPGDSGGPLITGSGRVVGMDTAASSNFLFSAVGGVGFAIPIATAQSIAKVVIAHRSARAVHLGATGFLGVDVRNPSYLSYSTITAGALILNVVPGSPAQAAGLVSGDVIDAIGSAAVSSSTSLMNALLRYGPGSKVDVHYLDQFDAPHSAVATLTSGPPQ